MKANFVKVIIPTALVLLMAGCAQVGPPLPPSLELPKPVTDLRATRKGNVVTLNWTQPTRTMDRLPVRYLGPTLVCRKLKSEFTACENIAAELPAPASVPRSPARSKKLGRQNSSSPAAVAQTYSDTLPSAWLQLDPSVDVVYAVEVMNRNYRAAGLSNLVHVPAILTLPPPNDLSADLSGDGVALSWTSSGEPQGGGNTSVGDSGKTLKPEFRYRIYRRDESSGQDAIAGEIPIESTGVARFTDSGFEWEKTFLYRITAVSVVKRPEGEVSIEGDDSSPVRVVAHDVFPPSVPTGLQAAYSGEGQKPFVDLIWAPVTSADLAGYNVYRSESDSSEAIVKLNYDLVKTPSYRDPDVVSGKTYTYFVAAVDVRGNESQRSEAASEAVP
jgi:hypothetical protein